MSLIGESANRIDPEIADASQLARLDYALGISNESQTGSTKVGCLIAASLFLLSEAVSAGLYLVGVNIMQAGIEWKVAAIAGSILSFLPPIAILAGTKDE